MRTTSRFYFPVDTEMWQTESLLLVWVVWREQLRRRRGTGAAVAAQSGSDVVGNVAAGTHQAHT